MGTIGIVGTVDYPEYGGSTIREAYMNLRNTILDPEEDTLDIVTMPVSCGNKSHSMYVDDLMNSPYKEPETSIESKVYEAVHSIYPNKRVYLTPNLSSLWLNLFNTESEILEYIERTKESGHQFILALDRNFEKSLVAYLYCKRWARFGRAHVYIETMCPYIHMNEEQKLLIDCVALTNVTEKLKPIDAFDIYNPVAVRFPPST